MNNVVVSIGKVIVLVAAVAAGNIVSSKVDRAAGTQAPVASDMNSSLSPADYFAVQMACARLGKARQEPPADLAGAQNRTQAALHFDLLSIQAAGLSLEVCRKAGDAPGLSLPD